MFKLFRRRKDKPSIMYGIFQKVDNAFERRQRQVTNYLNRRAERLTIRQLKWGLLIFCLAFGGVAALIIVQAFHHPAYGLAIDPITVPAHVIPKDDSTYSGALLTLEERQHIQSFQFYLDSLQRTEKGKAIYDSIAKHRPGLLDSLAIIHQFYYKQLKTK